MPRRRAPEPDAPIGEANVLPVLNIMFLLIPALLLAMEVASMAAVAVNPPKFCGDCGASSDAPNKQPLNLTVHVLAEGFRVSAAGQQHGAEAGRERDSSQPSIMLAKPSAPASDYARYDYAALEALAHDYKREYPDEVRVKVSAEGDIPAQVLISTLDALRGFDCKLGQPSTAAAIPEQCLFIEPVIVAGGR
jgi:hypothetical protein